MKLLERLPIILIILPLLGVFMLANLGLKHITAQADVTEDQRYTLSQATRGVLSNLEEPVTLRYYLSESDNTLPLELRSYASYVRDMLNRFAKVSNGMISVDIRDPLPDSDAEVSAQLDGIRGHRIADGVQAYMGLCVSSLKKNEVVPFLNPERETDLEYDLISRIQRVVLGEKRKAAIYSNMSTFGKGSLPPWALVQMLDQFYDIKHLEDDQADFPPDLELLLVIHPQDPSPKFDRQVEEFLHRGGSAVVLMDPVTVSRIAYNEKLSEKNASSSWKSFMDALGYEFTSNQVVLDMSFKHRINRGNGNEVLNSVLMVNEKGVNPEHSTTEGMQRFMFPVAGTFLGDGRPSMEKMILIGSSADSQLYPHRELIELSQATGEKLLNGFKADRELYPFVMLLEGHVPRITEEEVKTDAKRAKICLVGDVDMVTDPFAGSMIKNQDRLEFQAASSNLPFLMNVVDYMSGNTGLNEVRGRSQTSRPLTKLLELQRKAEEKYLSKIDELEKEQRKLADRLSPEQLSAGIVASRGSIDGEARDFIQEAQERRQEVNQELRLLRREFRASVQKIESSIKWLNIGLLPLFSALIGVAVTSWRHFKGRAKA